MSSPDDSRINRLVDAWLEFDVDPPMAELHDIASRFPLAVAESAIKDIGRVGRLRMYRSYIVRFVALRNQAKQLAGVA